MVNCLRPHIFHEMLVYVPVGADFGRNSSKQQDSLRRTYRAIASPERPVVRLQVNRDYCKCNTQGRPQPLLARHCSLQNSPIASLGDWRAFLPAYSVDGLSSACLPGQVCYCYPWTIVAARISQPTDPSSRLCLARGCACGRS